LKKFLIVTAAALAIAGCKREGPSDENSVNIVADNAYENMMPEESVMPIDNMAINAANVAEAPAPPPSIDEQQQMQEDADATGMTARTDREAEAGAGNSADAAVDRR
jgi:hypothetical protein